MSNQVLLVENDSRQYDSLTAELKAAGWQVNRAVDKGGALQRIKDLTETTPLAVVAIDLGLPPSPDGVTEGLNLVKELRSQSRFKELQILVYTMQQAVASASLVRRFLAMRVSFIYLRPMTEPGPFSNVLKYVSQNYFLLSPAYADSLQSVVPDRPDPLTDDMWETLRSLSKGLTQEEAARELYVVKDTVRDRLDKAKAILIERDELLRDAHQSEILEWYRTHCVRYARDQFPGENNVYKKG